MKTILITGATGFLGTHLVELLRREEPNARLRLMSRSASVSNGTSQIESVAADITNAEQVRRAIEGVDEIYHLAGTTLGIFTMCMSRGHGICVRRPAGLA